MYAIIEDDYLARVPPTMLGEDYERAVEEVTRKELQGSIVDYVPDNNSRVDMQKCYIVTILEITKNGDGIIVHGDGGVYQNITYKALAFIPKMNEIVEGVVVSVVPKIGAFLRFGPFEGLLHVGQIMDDRIEIDEGNKRLIGKDTNREIRAGDKLRVRVVMLNISSSSPNDRRIGFTMKQPGLGKLQWLKNDPSEGVKPDITGESKPKKSSRKRERTKHQEGDSNLVSDSPIPEEDAEEESLGEEEDLGEEL
ncbi:DNA-directed RNA polymerase [Cuniculiplasma sp. SKW4]|uniref:DNA-directed RNA polymerase n=1 Tax=Cuniculiplasma sp. SKW4 TaxID=3400171 RepID=UPI003FD33741